MKFEQFNLHPQVAAGVKAMGFTSPTPIQEKGIPPVLEGRDVMGLAQTGTGKTAAFVLPMLHRLLAGPRGHVRALIIAPTRELAEQIHEAITSLGKETKLRSATIYGGVRMKQQIRALRGHAEIIVACPGRLLDHLERRNADLSRLELLVLDEADRMFDMGFLPAIRKIVRSVPKDRQTLVFSATMPKDIRQLAQEILRNPVTIEIGHAAPVDTVTHSIYPVAPHQKTAMLKHLLRQHDPRSTLIFTRTKHKAKRLAEILDKENHFVTSLQGNLSQNKRQKALDGFRKGQFHILVATDIAARGIDVSKVSHVINYDIPDTAEAYTHRIGRTGRAENTGEAFTLVTHEDEAMVRTIEQMMDAPLERVKVENFDYHAPKPKGNEFARGPRQPQGRRNAPGSRSGKSKAKGPSASGRRRTSSQRGNR